jgi:hypothetical protein
MATTTASVDGAAQGASPLRARALTLALVAFGLVANTAGLALGLSVAGRPDTLQLTPLGSVGAFAFVLTNIAVGLVLRSRRPDNGIGWVFVAFGAAAGLSHLTWSGMLVQQIPGADRGVGEWVSWLGAVFTIGTWTYLNAALILRFPGGDAASPAEARLLRWAPLPCLIASALVAIRPGTLVLYPAFDNPLPTPPDLHDALVVASTIAVVAAVVPQILAVLATIRRYHDATSVERLQLRWFAYGAGLTATTGVVYVVLGGLLAPADTVIREGTFALFIFSACSLPIAVVEAITRHRLYAIDQIIGRTVAYGALTAILAGLYAASLRLFNALFVAATGETSEAALVMTTLVLATTFTPIKGRLERLAALRFPPVPDPSAGAPAARGHDATAITMPVAAIATDLDARIAAIARQVAREVLDEQRRAGG